MFVSFKFTTVIIKHLQNFLMKMIFSTQRFFPSTGNVWNLNDVYIFKQISTGKCKEMAQVYAIIPLDSFIDRPDHLPLVCPLSLCILNQSTAIAVILAVICTKNKSQEIGQIY